MKALLFLLLTAKAFAGDAYLVESRVQADLENTLSRIIRKDQYLVQVNVEISNTSVRRIFETETTIGNAPEVLRRPAAEVTAGFVAEPEARPVGPAKEERQTYRMVDSPKVEKIRVQIQVDDKLSENVLNQARALTNAYLSSNYPDVGSLRVTEVSMLRPEWWELGSNHMAWLGWIGSFCLLMLLLVRNTLSARAVAPVKMETPPVPAPAKTPEPVVVPPPKNDDSRRRLLSRVVQFADCFRAYHARLTPEQRIEVWTILHGPAFESVLERQGLEVPRVAVLEEVKEERIQWHDKNFGEFVEATQMQDKKPFGFLPHLTDEQLATLAGHEDAKAVCLMLRFMKPRQAATILDNFSQEKKLEILSHVPNLKASTFNEVSSLENQVRESVQKLPTHFFGLGKEDSAFWGQVLGESKDQDHLVEALEKTQSDLLPQLKKLRFKLEDAVQYEAAILDKVLNDIENDVLCMGLASCDAQTVEAFMKVLTQQRRELVEQQITNSKAMPKEALAAARHTLTNKFREFLS